MFKVELLIPFLIKNKLTTSQFYLLYCVHNNFGDTINLYRKHYPSDNGSMIGESATKDLMDRGFLKQIPNGYKFVEGKGKVPVYKYIVSDKFLEIFIDETQAIRDIVKVYPNYFRNPDTDQITFLKNVDFSKLGATYYTIIDKSSIEHTEVIKDIEFMKKYNLINVPIDVFIHEKKWMSVREARYLENPLEVWE